MEAKTSEESLDKNDSVGGRGRIGESRGRAATVDGGRTDQLRAREFASGPDRRGEGRRRQPGGQPSSSVHPRRNSRQTRQTVWSEPGIDILLESFATVVANGFKIHG